MEIRYLATTSHEMQLPCSVGEDDDPFARDKRPAYASPSTQVPSTAANPPSSSSSSPNEEARTLSSLAAGSLSLTRSPHLIGCVLGAGRFNPTLGIGPSKSPIAPDFGFGHFSFNSSGLAC